MTAWKPLGALAMLLILTACQPTTRTGAIEVREGVAATVTAVCSVWRPITYSSRDTPETQLGARQNNAARDAFCQ